MWPTTALVSEGAPKGKGEATGQPGGPGQRQDLGKGLGFG